MHLPTMGTQHTIQQIHIYIQIYKHQLKRYKIKIIFTQNFYKIKCLRYVSVYVCVYVFIYLTIPLH